MKISHVLSIVGILIILAGLSIKYINDNSCKVVKVCCGHGNVRIEKPIRVMPEYRYVFLGV